MKKEVVQHGGDAVDHDGVGENGSNLGRDHLDRVNSLVAHDVVKPCQHAHVSVSILGLGALGGRQTRPSTVLSLFLILSDLSHVLLTTRRPAAIIGLQR